jgi:hypothetical protein
MQKGLILLLKLLRPSFKLARADDDLVRRRLARWRYQGLLEAFRFCWRMDSTYGTLDTLRRRNDVACLSSGSRAMEFRARYCGQARPFLCSIGWLDRNSMLLHRRLRVPWGLRNALMKCKAKPLNRKYYSRMSLT